MSGTDLRTFVVVEEVFSQDELYFPELFNPYLLRQIYEGTVNS